MQIKIANKMHLRIAERVRDLNRRVFTRENHRGRSTRYNSHVQGMRDR